MDSASSSILDIDNLVTQFRTDQGFVTAVNGLSLHIGRGKTLGLVGESGSGKSVTSLSIMQLLPENNSRIAQGRIAFLGRDLVKLPGSELRKIRGNDISMIFQEPGTSLNPVYKVGSQVAEALLLHGHATRENVTARVIELFDEVGIPNPAERIHSYPHEMSGGQKQRVMIAMALACNPQLLIADEPTTALDVTIQAQILRLIRKLQETRQMSVLFITHDLGVIAEVADDVAVMFRGKLVEQGPVEQIFARPAHPYTRGLLACRPRLDSTRKRLNTVADFMDLVEDPVTKEFKIVERTKANERLEQAESTARDRLFSPRSEVTSLGYDVSTIPASRFVPEGTAPLLSVTDLQVYYPIRTGLLRRVTGHIKAVDGVSFNVYRGQTLGLVGESGCGKTTTGRAIMRLISFTGGGFEFAGMKWSEFREGELRRHRRRMQIVFQDPYASLNPRMTVEDHLVEAMTVHKLGEGKSDRRDMAASLLVEVGLLESHLTRYPHEFSGGQRQRICIARALAVEPEFIICDESVSALDVSVQAQVLNLLKDLQEKRGLTYIFISHDLSVVKFMSDMMAVMNQGKLVEYGPSELIYADPQNEYTRRLIDAIPQVSIERLRERVAGSTARVE
ncbi:MAG: ABC transporter ATP-binding protein [Planctomyces sp.]|nr:ABC transporter ATP-binding protein [Planctomyces sp.]